MRTLTLRKAFKTSCELKERCVSGKTCLTSKVGKYDIYDKMGKLEEVVDGVHSAQQDEINRQVAAINLVCDIRTRIQEANNKPLPYAEGATINDLIARQATLKTLLGFYPEDTEVSVTDVRGIQLTAERNRETIADSTKHYRSSTTTSLNVQGTSQEIADLLSEQRLAIRVELESVTGKLAYANITETVELTDEEAEILREFRIPV
jgi:hypothetical protein